MLCVCCVSKISSFVHIVERVRSKDDGFLCPECVLAVDMLEEEKNMHVSCVSYCPDVAHVVWVMRDDDDFFYPLVRRAVRVCEEETNIVLSHVYTLFRMTCVCP